MYVPPIKGSAIWVWNAQTPMNWTVLFVSSTGIGGFATHLVNEDNRVVATTTPKYVPSTFPLLGNIHTTAVATTAMPNRAQKTINQGRSISPVPVNGCFPLGGRDHLATNHPANICAGKSSKTATARSSFDRPCSRSLRPVTESLTRKPILQVRRIRRYDWMSGS